MISYSVPTFSKYVEVLETWSSPQAEVLLFRGQGRRRGLIPGLGRIPGISDEFADLARLENEINKQFQLQGAVYLPTDSNWLERLVLAQHFGLRTRLLDWSSNPMVALWFACNATSIGDVFVYAFNPSGGLIPEPYELAPYQLTNVGAFQPRLTNPRVIAQQGWFTIHPTAQARNPLENFLTKDGIVEFRIHSNARAAILRSLNRQGVNHRSLFPDLEGLCRHLSWNMVDQRLAQANSRMARDILIEALEQHNLYVAESIPLPPHMGAHVVVADPPRLEDPWIVSMHPDCVSQFMAAALRAVATVARKYEQTSPTHIAAHIGVI